MNTTSLPYRLGPPDTECRYPVIIGEDLVIGWAWRWHRDWQVADSSGQRTNLHRPEKGTRGVDMAAGYLARMYAEGVITPVPLAKAATEAPVTFGPVPLLDPRMPTSARNIAGAERAFAALAVHRWTARAGFPGSDNPWALACDLCGWSGPRYWSHLRGRNGQPPSTHRHDGGCVGDAKVRELIAIYGK